VCPEADPLQKPQNTMYNFRNTFYRQNEPQKKLIVAWMDQE
jgi:hypothetical protein